MNHRFSRFFFAIVTILVFHDSRGQNFSSDTTSVNSLNQQCRQLILKGLYRTADSVALLAEKQSKKINFKKGLFYAYTNLGVIYWYQSNFPVALKNYLDALKIA